MVLRWALLMLFLAAPIAASAQNSIWWTNQGDSQFREQGKLQELKEKRRVFVSVSYRSTDPNQVSEQTERDRLRGAVSRALTAYKGLEIVLAPEKADLAISVTAMDNVGQGGQSGAGGNFAASLDPDVETPLEILVLVRGAMQRDGGYRPRVVWELSSPNVRGEAAPAAGFALDGFISQLKKVRGESTKK
jgi:hypothetical protein